MTTHPNLEQRAKEVAIEIWRDLWGNNAGMEVTKSAIAEREIIECHLHSFAAEAASVAAIKTAEFLAGYLSQAFPAAAEIIRKSPIEGIETWIQHHDAAVRLEEHKLCCNGGPSLHVCGTSPEPEYWCQRRMELERLATLEKEAEEKS